MAWTPSVLVVDDEELIRWSLCEHLRGLGWQVREASRGREALEAVDAEVPDLILLDLRMPGMSGLEVLQALAGREVHSAVVVVTADAQVETAVEATQRGAAAYLTKPFNLGEITQTLEGVLEARRDAARVVLTEDDQSEGYGRFLGRAPSLAPVFSTLRRLERIDAPTVLILGESGTGKDVIARMVHERGPRAKGPFLDIDCASLPAPLIESELFGHERGAFTDAKDRKKGLFEVAKGGVVFLDELGELPLPVQAKLLRALESRTFRRVGGTTPIPMDAALVAATNKRLDAEVAAGRFREDLYFRLNVVPVRLPALRERREDIPLLASHFLSQCNARFGRELQGLTGEAMALLERWSGRATCASSAT